MPRKPMTEKQAQRQHSRDHRTGRYEQHMPCELCARSVRDQHSDHRCNDALRGRGVVLCPKCCGALGLLPDRSALAALVNAERRAPDVRAALPGALLKAEAAARAGCASLRVNQHLPIQVAGVYRSDEAGMEIDPSLPWTTVCEIHHTLVSSESKRAATWAAADTTSFCDECREAAAARRAPAKP